MMLIVPSALKPLAGSAGAPAFKMGFVSFVPLATVKKTCPAALVFIRTAKSVPLGATNWTGQVVFGVGLARLTILRMNWTLPGPSEAGSAMESFTMSCAGCLSSASPTASVSTVTPGTTQGLSGGGQGDGVTALQEGPAPTPLTAVTL